ncbi:MAG: GGDEF domain-containing protein [Alcanivorax sp.]|nr:GGDEF domain-containing protein [Alcanivorax sp.]
MKLFKIIAATAHQVSHSDQFAAIRATIVMTLAAIIVSVILTGVTVLAVRERDWLSAMVLAIALPLLLLPAPFYAISTRLLALDRNNRQLQQQAREDHLTGLFNRPHLLGMLERELSLSQRHDYPVSILLIEISDFNQLIDNHGRSSGEQLLKLFADCIREKIRESDLFGRFDGAQFLLVLPHTNFEAAVHMGEGLRALTTRINQFSETGQIQISARIGVASTENSGRNLNHLLNEADYALYQNRNDQRSSTAINPNNKILSDR